ncbi:MAG: glycosyltransferase, partial [Cyanobacteria bacterium P01_H01_bin.130]
MIIPLFEPALWVGLVTLPCTSALLISHHLGTWETPFRRQVALVGLWAIAGLGSWAITASLWAWAVAAIGIVASWALRSPLRDYFLATRILLTALIINVVAGVGLSIVFINGLAISSLTRTLLLANLGVGLLSLPLILAALLPTQAYILRKRWRRPRRSLPPQPRDHYPKVSFHVPSHAEPPEVVCATLDALSRVRYPNFEVLLIDNNTVDPALWYPLKDRCEALNDKLESGAIASENRVHRPFRFFHVEGIKGAKAGALNFALEQTDPDAELVSVIDADYQAQPNFLERLVGFFDDPNLGFVQTPHDYRGWQNNVYLRACYWECMVFFRLQLSCLSEWTASFIIGTMCIVRRQAIEQAGGWATWCLTEDSESAVRIHALG